MGQRITGMTSGQKSFPCASSLFKFAQHGKCGAWVSDLLPQTATVVDDIASLFLTKQARSRPRLSLETPAAEAGPGPCEILYLPISPTGPNPPVFGAGLSVVAA